jgi:hypothetical protein
LLGGFSLPLLGGFSFIIDFLCAARRKLSHCFGVKHQLTQNAAIALRPAAHLDTF